MKQDLTKLIGIGLIAGTLTGCVGSGFNQTYDTRQRFSDVASTGGQFTYCKKEAISAYEHDGIRTYSDLDLIDAANKICANMNTYAALKEGAGAGTSLLLIINGLTGGKTLGTDGSVPSTGTIGTGVQPTFNGNSF